MDQLASLAGVLFVALLRLLYIRLHRRQENLSSPPKRPALQEDEESRPLIAPPRAAQESLTCRRKLICSLAAVAYIAVAVFVAVATVKEYGGPVLKDSRFVFGRGGMVTVALIVLARTLFYKSSDILRELQADAVALIAIPYVMEVLGTPVAQFPERRLVDFLVAPALGAICFLLAKD